MKSIGLIVAMLGLAGIAAAVTSNLDNHGIGDSNNTASTFVYRDTNSQAYIGLTVQTTTQLSLAAAAMPVGTLVLAQESVGGTLVTNSYNLCHSTANAIASWVYLSVSTSVPAKVGAACSN